MSDWSEQEIDLIIADYFDMLSAELKGSDYNKTTHRNRLQQFLNHRSEGSIEFKHQNISAVLVKNGSPYIKGYKPRWNYQQRLEEKILESLFSNVQLEKNFEVFANQGIKPQSIKVEYNAWKVSAPSLQQSLFHEPTIDYRKPVKRNYLQLEQLNQSIGEFGEKLVLEYEKWRLEQAGLSKFIGEIKWVSKELGDGAGFDILSKNDKGDNIFIEVKSTTLGKETPIFFTKRENDFSDEKSKQFYLYRVFDLRSSPKMFNKQGSFKDICSMEAINFKGYF